MLDSYVKISAREIDMCIKEAAMGDISALKTLYENFKTPVYLLAVTILKDNALAEDILQETFIEIKSSAKNYTQGTNARGWILSITRNLCKDCLRKRHHEISHPFEEHETSGDILEKCTTSKDMLSNIIVCDKLSHLDEVQRNIVILHVFTGLKHTEISKLLSLPYGTVLWKYSVAIKKLKKLYEEDFYGEGAKSYE